jgi:hypothetical protein
MRDSTIRRLSLLLVLVLLVIGAADSYLQAACLANVPQAQTTDQKSDSGSGSQSKREEKTSKKAKTAKKSKDGGTMKKDEKKSKDDDRPCGKAGTEGHAPCDAK